MAENLIKIQHGQITLYLFFAASELDASFLPPPIQKYAVRLCCLTHKRGVREILGQFLPYLLARAQLSPLPCVFLVFEYFSQWKKPAQSILRLIQLQPSLSLPQSTAGRSPCLPRMRLFSRFWTHHCTLRQNFSRAHPTTLLQLTGWGDCNGLLRQYFMGSSTLQVLLPF